MTTFTDIMQKCSHICGYLCPNMLLGLSFWVLVCLSVWAMSSYLFFLFNLSAYLQLHKISGYYCAPFFLFLSSYLLFSFLPVFLTFLSRTVFSVSLSLPLPLYPVIKVKQPFVFCDQTVCRRIILVHWRLRLK